MRLPSASRSRNALAWGVGVFFLTQIGLSASLDFFAPLARFPSARRILREANGSSPRIVFLGSSRFGASLDEAEINRLLHVGLPSGSAQVLNAAVPAGDAISAEFLLDRLLAQAIRPGWVVLEISPENLNFPGPWLDAQIMRQLGWRELPSHFAEATQSNNGTRYLGSLLLPALVHRERLLEALGEWYDPPQVAPRDRLSPTSIDWKALLPPVEIAAIDNERERLRPGAQAARRWLRNYRVGGQTPLALRRVLQRCHDEKIGVVLLMPPLAGVHREEYLPLIESAFQAHLDELRQSFDCRIVDARDWLPDELFGDASHPSIPEGQQRFSRLLTQRLLLGLFDPSSLVARKVGSK